jgi:hypothetical protein
METANISDLVSAIKDINTWVILFVVAIFGIIGGLSHKLTSPVEDKTSLLGYIVIGAVASLAVLFVFIPKDAVRLVAISLAAGYGGKAVLDALEARVKTAIAQAETAKAKEKGKEAVEAAQQAISIAQNLSQIKEVIVDQPKENFQELLKTKLPVDLHAFAEKPAKTYTDELKQLSGKLDFLNASFTK